MVTKPRKIGPKWLGPNIINWKMQTCVSSPRGSILSFEGGILLSISLGLAVRTFWSDLEKCSKLASEKIWGQHFGLGSFLEYKMVPKK